MTAGEKVTDVAIIRRRDAPPFANFYVTVGGAVVWTAAFIPGSKQSRASAWASCINRIALIGAVVHPQQERL